MQTADVPQHQASRHVLEYQAPFVVEKLLNNKTVANEAEALSLFREVVRYLWLAEMDQSCSWPMFSLRVDEAWHQFVLFTREYSEFCQRHFGRFLHHAPSTAPIRGDVREASWSEFSRFYEQLFGTPPPELWDDANSVEPHRRLIRDHETTVSLERGRAELLAGGRLLARCNAAGGPALGFISAHRTFYVRELPGLDLEERVALCRALVRSKTLRVLR